MNKNTKLKIHIGLLSSENTRVGNEDSILNKFIKKCIIHKSKLYISCTGGTFKAIKDTFQPVMYEDFIESKNIGLQGGVVQIAALCVKDDIKAVFFFSDPSDTNSSSPENRALQRICIRKQIPLLTTLRAAEEWLAEELDGIHENFVKQQDTKLQNENLKVYVSNYANEDDIITGFPSNDTIDSPPLTQTIALISHDNCKEDLIRFVEEYPDVVSSFHRILATGTSGWLIKTLFASNEQRSRYLKQASCKLGEKRYNEFLSKSLDIQKKLWMGGFPASYPEMTEKIFPLHSGPEGGDVMIAEQVLERCCDYIIFTQDPMSAHAHDADIQLLKRTCQIAGTYSVCISDKNSSEQWAKAKRNTWKIN